MELDTTPCVHDTTDLDAAARLTTLHLPTPAPSPTFASWNELWVRTRLDGLTQGIRHLLMSVSKLVRPLYERFSSLPCICPESST